VADYETLRQKHLMRLFEVLPEHLSRLTRPRDQLLVER